MSSFRELPAQGNVEPVWVHFDISCCGNIHDGVGINLGKGDVVISFMTLTRWYWRAVLFRLMHPIWWIRALIAHLQEKS